MSPVSERVVVITGAARGIGQALARGFQTGGATVVALDVDWSDRREFAAEVTADGHSMATQVDITDREGLEAVRDEVLAR